MNLDLGLPQTHGILHFTVQGIRCQFTALLIEHEFEVREFFAKGNQSAVVRGIVFVFGGLIWGDRFLRLFRTARGCEDD
jgi:hypothetical protein